MRCNQSEKKSKTKQNKTKQNKTKKHQSNKIYIAKNLSSRKVQNNICILANQPRSKPTKKFSRLSFELVMHRKIRCWLVKKRSLREILEFFYSFSHISNNNNNYKISTSTTFSYKFNQNRFQVHQITSLVYCDVSFDFVFTRYRNITLSI